jgi:hypothetical protein
MSVTGTIQTIDITGALSEISVTGELSEINSPREILELFWLTLISATVENENPTNVILTFPTPGSLTAADFTIEGFTIASATWSGTVLTLVLNEVVTPDDGDLTIYFIDSPEAPTTIINNVEWSSYWSTRWYGIEIDEANSSPDVTRIQGADATGYHATLPVHALLKACLLADDGTVNYYLDPTDWTKQVGGAASNLDGTDGQVMIEWGDFYYKVEENYPSAGKHQIKICEGEATGFTLVPKHYVSAYEANVQRSVSKFGSFKNTGTDFRGGNNTAAWDAAANTLLGMPVTNVNRTNGRAYARARGAGWNLYGYNDHKWLFWFFAIEYATLNSQKAVNAVLTAEGYKQGGLGEGVSTAVSTTWNTFNSYNPFVPCGASDSLASGSGEYTFTKVDFDGAGTNVNFAVNRYRGHEMPFGHIWIICDGINIQVLTDGDGGTSKLFSADDPSVWTDANYVEYTDRGNIARASGYMSKALMGAGAEIEPSAAAGGSTTYYCDYFYTSITASSMRMLLIGGTAGRSVDGGFVCSNSGSGPALASAYVGFRIRFQ